MSDSHPTATDLVPDVRAPATLVSLAGVTKHFGAVRALSNISLDVPSGQCLGLVGHNGAGKSTLINLLTGALRPDTGRVAIRPALGNPASDQPHDIAGATACGVRCVYQELSLCPNLNVAENVRLRHRGLSGLRWRHHAQALANQQLDAIFPDHGIELNAAVDQHSIARRQMIEIACAFTVTHVPARLVILDEPTSSLDAPVAAQLLAHVRRFVAAGGTCLLTSHRLGEILQATDRTLVMRDGQIVDDRSSEDFTRDSLIKAMGRVAATGNACLAAQTTDPPVATVSTGPEPQSPVIWTSRRDASTVPRLQFAATGDDESIELAAWPGEIIALAGLEGQGQSDMLSRLFAADTQDTRMQVRGRCSLVSGDRQRDGLFPLWSISENISVGSLAERATLGFVNRRTNASLATDWQSRINIRTPDMDHPILSLSGGNQQKALFARALAAKTDIVLMDDPMRGVDIQTKREVYRLVRREADAGRTFVWYTTELEELLECDHIYVFRDGVPVAGMARDELDETQVLDASFALGTPA